MKSDYRKLEKAIGYRFKKRAHLELAVTHPSYRYEDKAVTDDNQRLEYLGDAVLSLIAADYLYKSDPQAREGDMSQLRSRLTQDRKLALIGATIGVSEYLRLGHGEKLNGGAWRASNIADAVEAIIGAAWIDGGDKAVRRIFQKVFLPELERMKDAPVISNPKGELQEYAQSSGHGVPIYTTVDTIGPEHDRTFTVEVKACEKVWSAAAGSKREAERKAAVEALEELKEEGA
ncbi:MAG: ribonuclease III [Pontiella sp.]|nr:ribonuclease III [Pontiella sp.]